MSRLPAPPSPVAGATSDDVVAWVAEHLGDLAREGVDGVRPGVVRGGQAAADTALAGLDVGGYARTRSTVVPERRRGATRMSPSVRHGLVTLPELWTPSPTRPPATAARTATSCCGRSTPATSTPGSAATSAGRCGASSRGRRPRGLSRCAPTRPAAPT